MILKPLTPSLSVCAQIRLEDLEAIQAAGFRSLVCNRPDGESPDQTGWDTIAAAARARGLEVAWLPAETGKVTNAQGEAFGELLAQLPEPVLAYCRSGLRSSTLWALSQAGRQPTEAILTRTQAVGYDLSAMAQRITDLGAARASANAPGRMQVEGFFDPKTWTVSYIVMDTGTRDAAVIDSVLDYDPKSGRTSTASADRLIERIQALGARVQWHLETHVHADHLSGAAYLRERVDGRIAIGHQITTVQQVFGELFNVEPEFKRDGSQFDHLLQDGETFQIGQLQARALHTPGHTPACMTYVVSDGHDTAAFVGDTLFMPDYGTARCDFPGGDARTLYRSINKVLSLPPQTTLYLCHDYQPGGREVKYVTTVEAQRASNIHVKDGISEEAFVAMREARDATLEMPVLILPAVQVNMRAGELPPPESNGQRYLKIPLDAI
jgi:uncharacterized protein (TIGR01244 family)